MSHDNVTVQPTEQRVTVEPVVQRVAVTAPAPARVRTSPSGTHATVMPAVTRRVGVATGLRGPAGPPGPANERLVVQAVAAIDLSGHRAVVPQSDGTVVYADPTNVSHLDRPVWLTEGALAAGASADLLAAGELTEPGWSWVPGAVWLGPAGTLVQALPLGVAYWRRLGRSAGPTVLFFAPEPAIRLED